MNEIEELEQYNKELNYKLAQRKVTNLVRCTACFGNGYFYPTVWDMWIDRKMCKDCQGQGYVNSST